MSTLSFGRGLTVLCPPGKDAQGLASLLGGALSYALLEARGTTGLGFWGSHTPCLRELGGSVPSKDHKRTFTPTGLTKVMDGLGN